MPGRLKVRLLGARDLPVMDRASDLTDAFAEVCFHGEKYKTEVCKKSLNPQWNSEWFKFEVDDEVLQDEPLDIRVLDYDTYSAHDAIGKVYIDLTPLLTNDLPYVISGWFPIYDTMHGIRGELNIQVKVELFNDLNKFRQSSCGIQFFCSAAVPSGYRMQGLQGFVEELVVNDDPEYQLIDKIRTSRASNEARQRLFSKLSGGLQRKVGVKVLEMGGNAVLGYTQNFDLEGESGIVVRAIGTAVSISRTPLTQFSSLSTSPGVTKDSPLPEDSGSAGSPPLAGSNRHSVSPVRTTGAPSTGCGGNRRLSESEAGSPPGGLSVADSGSGINLTTCTTLPTRLTPPRHTLPQQNISLLEYPFFTMRSFPPGFILNLGSVVSARSVKLLDKIHNPEEPETRDMWWSEIRTEIRSHARSMNCNAVLGYVEQTSICDEIIILSASGTAARITFDGDHIPSQGTQPPPTQVLPAMVTSPGDGGSNPEREKDKDHRLTVDIGLANQLAQVKLKLNAAIPEKGEDTVKCSLCHIPYRANTLPFPVNLAKCALCRDKKVPDVLFTTIDPPKEIPILSHGTLIQARVCRARNKGKGSEAAAREVSDSLPFLEYELHSQLLNKLKLRGLNAIFGLKIQICLGENMIAALATGTTVFLGPMPQPPLPKLSTQVQVATEEENRDLEELQAKITGIVQQHRERLSLEMAAAQEETSQEHSPFGAPTDDSDEEPSDAEAFFSNKDTFVLEVDDPKDEILSLILRDFVPPDGFEMCNTQLPPGVSPARINSHMQMFTQMAQIRFVPHVNSKLEFSDIFDMLLRRMCFKLRRLAPCCLTDLNFTMEIPDDDEVQVAVTGCCLSLGEPRTQTPHLLSLPQSATPGSGPRVVKPAGGGTTEDLMFTMDGEGEKEKEAPSAVTRSHHPLMPSASIKLNKLEDKRKLQSNIPRKLVGVELTPLPTVVGGTIVKYLGNYNFFLIRESTSVKECGGLGGFMQSFVSEVMAIVRGHVSALGGNALVGYQMSHCVLFSNLHKNQAQCLINVCGDAVQVNYDNETLSVELPPTLDSSG